MIRYKKGDILRLIDVNNLLIPKGSEAKVVNDCFEGDLYVIIKWLNSTGFYGTSSYFADRFVKVVNKWSDIINTYHKTK